MIMKLTKQIQEAVCKSELQKGNFVAENFTYFFTGELDVISVNKSEYVAEFEVKISRSDFKADAKKVKWQFFDTCLTPKYIPNYFSYVCPEGMINESELKPYMGLVYYTEKGLQIIRKPKLIHKFKHDYKKLISKMLRINNWKFYYGCQQMTLKNKEIAERNHRFLNK